MQLQLTIFNKQDTPSCVNRNNTVLNSEPVVMLLGVLNDERLIFSEHIDSMCLFKAGGSIKVR